MIKAPGGQDMRSNLRAEKDVRLRIDLLEGQSSSIAKMLAKAIKEHNEPAVEEYSKRLAANRGKIEELLWVLGEKAGQSILDLHVATAKSDSSLPVKEVIARLKTGELRMDDLSPETQAMVRKGALEIKNSDKQ